MNVGFDSSPVLDPQVSSSADDQDSDDASVVFIFDLLQSAKVVQSSFANPCQQLTGGFSFGTVPAAGLGGILQSNVWTLTASDASQRELHFFIGRFDSKLPLSAIWLYALQEGEDNTRCRPEMLGYALRSLRNEMCMELTDTDCNRAINASNASFAQYTKAGSSASSVNTSPTDSNQGVNAIVEDISEKGSQSSTAVIIRHTTTFSSPSGPVTSQSTTAPNTSSSTSSSQPSLSPTGSTPSSLPTLPVSGGVATKIPVAAVAGGTAGAVVVIVLCILLLCILRRRRSRQLRMTQDASPVVEDGRGTSASGFMTAVRSAIRSVPDAPQHSRESHVEPFMPWDDACKSGAFISAQPTTEPDAELVPSNHDGLPPVSPSQPPTVPLSTASPSLRRSGGTVLPIHSALEQAVMRIRSLERRVEMVEALPEYEEEDTMNHWRARSTAAVRISVTHVR